MKVVFDASTLILLAKIDLLRDSIGEMEAVIPEKVREECLAKNDHAALLIKTLINEGKIEVVKVQIAGKLYEIKRDFKIHEGEAEALLLSISIECPLAVDDWPTIKACRVMGKAFSTAIHFLLNLAAIGKLDEKTALAKLDGLAVYGRYNGKILEDAAARLKGGKT